MFTREIGKDIVDENIRRLIKNLVSIEDDRYTCECEGRVIDVRSWKTGWDWAHGVGLYGVWHYYTLTGSKEAWGVMEDWFDYWFKEGTVPKNINTMAPFLTLAFMYEETGNKTYLPYLDAWAEWAMHDLERTDHGGMQHVTYVDENYQQLWDDTLMMTVLPLAKIGKLLDRPEYVNEAKKQFLIHMQYLTDRKTGLFFHGFTFENNSNFANALWARGNSWITIAIPEFIDLMDLPAGDPIREYLIEVLKAQCDALVKYQSESGAWHTLIDDPSSYTESSATAGFAFGMLKAMRKRYIEKDVYWDAAIKGVRSVLSNVDQSGELLNTSYGTPMGHTLQFYKDIPIESMPYGQAMAIMCLGEALRLYA